MNAAPCLGSNEAKSKTNQKLNTLQTEGLQHTYICLCFVFLPQKICFWISGFYVVFPNLKLQATIILSICWTREGS